MANWVTERCREHLGALGKSAPGVIAVSAIAEGADTLFAEAAIATGVPLEIVIPFDGYEDDFSNAASLRRLEYLRSRAAREIRLPFQRRSNGAYAAAMHHVIETSDCVLAVWDGKAAAGPGGTGHAVGQLKKLGMPWIHLDVRARRVRFHPGRAESDTGLIGRLKGLTGGKP